MNITIDNGRGDCFKINFSDKDLMSELQNIPYDKHLNVFLWMLEGVTFHAEEAAEWIRAGWGSRYDYGRRAEKIIADGINALQYILDYKKGRNNEERRI